MTATLFPARFGEIEVRLGPARKPHSRHPARPVHVGSQARTAYLRTVYLRRRLVAGLGLVAFIAVVGISVHTVLADRGGVPASTPTIRSAELQSAEVQSAEVQVLSVLTAPASPALVSYIVQPGDSLWNLAERFHAARSMSSYVDALVTANGGAGIRPGQVVLLP